MSSPGAVRVRFVADAMLGSLARKLRILGFDTAYFKSGADAGIIRVATEEGRILLTADRALASLSERRGVRAVLLTGRTDAARLRALTNVARQLGLPLRKSEPLCSICNGALVRASKSELAGRIPSSVEARHKLFYRCATCGKAYWKGSHWKKLRSFERVLREAGNDSLH